MDPLQMIRAVEVELVDLETLIALLRAVDENAQTNADIVSAYPLIHDLLASKVAAAITAINPLVLRS